MSFTSCWYRTRIRTVMLPRDLPVTLIDSGIPPHIIPLFFDVLRCLCGAQQASLRLLPVPHVCDGVTYRAIREGAKYRSIAQSSATLIRNTPSSERRNLWDVDTVHDRRSTHQGDMFLGANVQAFLRFHRKINVRSEIRTRVPSNVRREGFIY